MVVAKGNNEIKLVHKGFNATVINYYVCVTKLTAF